MKSRLFIILNVEKPAAVEAAFKVVEWAEKNSFQPVFFPDDAKVLKLNKLDLSRQPAREEMAVVLGGDGTILKAARLLKGSETPVLGVNFGRVGFLSEIESDYLFPALEKLKSGNFQIEERIMLEVIFRKDGQEIKEQVLNEIVIGGTARARLLKFSLLINGEKMKDYQGDGLIVSTPTGSTAYSFSAGGPIISPSSECFLITPLCPYTLFNRALVLSPDEVVEVLPAEGIKLNIALDGVDYQEASQVNKVLVKKSDKKFRLIRVGKEKVFYRLLEEKLSFRRQQEKC